MAMKKSFLDELKEHKKKTASKRRGVVAVVAHREEIKQGLGAGFTLKDIYTVLSDKGQMPVTYSAFVKLVRKYVKEKGHQEKNQETEQNAKKKKSHVYNPDDHDIKDLI